nr:integrase, catalytic region, zinc finger, CCHC-type, peptidase aspartic, catalytic [Tanacetum cinerariifolium]
MKMLLEASKLTRDERESKLYDAFKHFCQNKGDTIHEYYVRFTKLINDMRNIKMTMPKMQLNSKFVNNMLPEWGRFVTAVRLNRGLKTSNYDHLYAYLKQHDAHANKNKMMLERYTQHAIDPLTFVAVVVYCGGQDSTFDDDVDEPLVQDLALNVDQVFQVDQCDAFDSDVDEAPTAHTMFMANLSSADTIYDEAGPSYDLNILSEVQNHDNYLDNVGEYHEVHEMQNNVQQNYVVDSDAEYTSDSNIILYEQYVENNVEKVLQSNVYSVPNDALMVIINDMHEQATQCIYANEQNKVVNESLIAELARYKE